MSCTTRCAANGRPPSQATQHRRSPGKPRPFGFRRYEPICGAAEPGRESLISTRNLQLAYRLISSLVWQTRRLPEDLIRGSLGVVSHEVVQLETKTRGWGQVLGGGVRAME